jgi:hypothetical protein
MGTPDGWDRICTSVRYFQIPLTYIAAIYTRQSSNHSRLNRIAYCPQYSVLRGKTQLHPTIVAKTQKTRRNNRTIDFPISPDNPRTSQSIFSIDTHKRVASFISEIADYKRYLMLRKRPRNSKALSEQQFTRNHTPFLSSLQRPGSFTPTSSTCDLLERGEVWHPIAGPAIARGLA